jgi:hypothetical protein
MPREAPRIRISNKTERLLERLKGPGEFNRDVLDRLLDVYFQAQLEEEEAAKQEEHSSEEQLLLPDGWSWSESPTLVALAQYQLDLVWDDVRVSIPFEGLAH